MNAFLLARKKVGPLELLPWTLTTQVAMQKLELSKFEETEQIAAIAWLQSREPEEVKAAIANGSAVEQIQAFSAWFPFALVKPVAEWCAEQNQMIEEGRVDVVSRDSGSSDAPGN